MESHSVLNQHHAQTIERAKEFMNNYFHDDISLNVVARHCHTSPFHFSRLFKKITSNTPHQYLLHLRLSHAELLLRNTSKPITDICFSSGFNSLEHFATMFRSRFKKNPSAYRKAE
jgi:AraC-like DNA-binding protein